MLFIFINLNKVQQSNIILNLMSFPKRGVTNNAGPSSQESQEDNHSCSFLHFDLLSINERKDSQSDCRETDLSLRKKEETAQPKQQQHKFKSIHKKDKESDVNKRQNLYKKKRITFLENRVEELEREVASLRRNQHCCYHCQTVTPQFYRERLERLLMPVGSAAGEGGKSASRDSLEFQQIDFHSPQSPEMYQKMWIFLGTMLFAMGSKITDFDGTIKTFKVLKQSVDILRRQVDKCQPKVGMEFFLSKQEMQQSHPVDGINFDPFFSKHEYGTGHFNLEGVRLESVEEYELFYDKKYHFHMKYDALLAIMEYAQDNCSIS